MDTVTQTSPLPTVEMVTVQLPKDKVELVMKLLDDHFAKKGGTQVGTTKSRVVGQVIGSALVVTRDTAKKAVEVTKVAYAVSKPIVVREVQHGVSTTKSSFKEILAGIKEKLQAKKQQA